MHELKARHVPLLSMSEKVAGILINAAQLS